MFIDQYGIHLGPLYLHFYGLILVLGILAGTLLSERLAKARSMNAQFIWDSLIWTLVAGIVGARLWHIFTPPPSSIAVGITTEFYLTHPLDALAIWNGGLGIPGAVIGGGAALYLLARRRGENFLAWADVIAPGLALGQAIGRWANFVNQELYGAPTDLPWAITIPPEKRLAGFDQFSTSHPLFLYESLWSLATVFFLIWVARKYSDRLKTGDVFLIYLITYPTIRFLLDFLRLDASMVAGINANQAVMLVVGVAALGRLLIKHRRGS
ncbi:MAG: prolipoprotein diacylglyceryl transferase [Chloroflexi bacterium]|nr:prolipoprotein diacylglyceryl transferase [Chloroflexota bacterium]